MKCKNCDSTLRTDYLFCPACGGKVIRNRITLKNLWVDILDRYFNLDNTFLRTFVHMFTQPETVTEGYLHGLRRKYLNPISYLGISLTLSGFIVFLMSKSIGNIDFDIFDTGMQTTGQRKIMDFAMDYQALVFVMYIPLMSVASWLCFEEKKYNFSERTIIFMYAMAHYSLFIFVPSILVLLIDSSTYLNFSIIAICAMFLFAGYVIKRITLTKGIALYARIFMFYVILGGLYFAISLAIPVIMFITGNLELKDFAPVKN